MACVAEGPAQSRLVFFKRGLRGVSDGYEGRRSCHPPACFQLGLPELRLAPRGPELPGALLLGVELRRRPYPDTLLLLGTMLYFSYSIT